MAKLTVEAEGKRYTFSMTTGKQIMAWLIGNAESIEDIGPPAPPIASEPEPPKRSHKAKEPKPAAKKGK